jgi:hypothetical protein
MVVGTDRKDRGDRGGVKWSVVDVGKTGLGKTMDARRDIYSKSIERCDQKM